MFVFVLVLVLVLDKQPPIVHKHSGAAMHMYTLL